MVGGWPTPLKNMSSSVGMLKFPTEWEVIQNSMVPVTTKRKNTIFITKEVAMEVTPDPRCQSRCTFFQGQVLQKLHGLSVTDGPFKGTTVTWREFQW